MKTTLLSIAVFFLLCPVASAKHAQLEKFYQDKWCEKAGGKTEIVLQDGTRCDCLTSRHAIEFDFGHKWAESLGQALNYSKETGLRGGIVLILEKKEDTKYFDRLTGIILHFKLPVDVWIMRAY